MWELTLNSLSRGPGLLQMLLLPVPLLWDQVFQTPPAAPPEDLPAFAQLRSACRAPRNNSVGFLPVKTAVSTQGLLFKSSPEMS